MFGGTIPNYTFADCSKLTTVPDTCRATGLEQMVFLNCTSLPSIQLPLVTIIKSNTFQGCKLLTSIQLPSVTALTNNVFSDATSLSSVYMPKIINIGNSAFSGCSLLKNLHINSNISLSGDPSILFGSSKTNDFFITTDNYTALSTKLNALTTNTSNLTASRIRMEYNPTSKYAAGDMVLTHTPSISATQYGELLTLFSGSEPTSGLHKTIYDNLNSIKAGQLLDAYNNHSELDALYSNILFDLQPHYKNFNTYINTVGTFIPGVSAQPDTAELIMTFANGTFSKKLVYKLNK